MVYSCEVCRRWRRKCIQIKGSEICKHCKERNKTCIRYKPSDPYIKIEQLTKQVEEQNIKIIELEKVNSKLKQDYKKIKANLIARQVLDRDMCQILE